MYPDLPEHYGRYMPEDKLNELQDDRRDILAELDQATGEGVGFYEKQLEDIDKLIAAELDRRGRAIQDEIRQRPKTPPPGSEHLFWDSEIGSARM